MAAPMGKCENRESTVTNRLRLIIRDYCAKKNIDYKKLNVCRQSRRLKNGDFIVPKGCIDWLPEDMSSLQDELVQHRERSKLPIGRVSQDDYHTLALFVARSLSFHLVISEVLHKGHNYGKIDLCESKRRVVLLNPSDLSAAYPRGDVGAIKKGGKTITEDNQPQVFQNTREDGCLADKKAELPGAAETAIPEFFDDSNSLSHNIAMQESSVDQIIPVTACAGESKTTSLYPNDSPSSLIITDSVSTNILNRLASEVPHHPDTFIQDGVHSAGDLSHDHSTGVNVLESGDSGNTQKPAEGIAASDLAHSEASRHVHTYSTEMAATEFTSQIPLSPVCLRTIALMQHVKELLKATGHPVMEVPVVPSAPVQELCHVLGYEPAGPPTSTETLATLVLRAEVSPFRHTTNHGKQGGSEECGGSTLVEDQSEGTVIDLRKFIPEAHLVQGQKAYDKNLHYVDVKCVDGPPDIIHQVARLEDSVQGEMLHVLEPSADVTCVHIVSENSAFTQQQTDLIWRMLSDKHIPVNQRHLICGSVVCRKDGISQCCTSAEEFIKLRFQQVKQLSDLKYGDELDSGWESSLMNLTAATIKFEMLNTACKNKLKLDVSQHPDGGPGAETRAGLFVVYNCARLATLFRHFQQEVEKGVYPELPSIDSVNFDLLREEEEWVLLFNYISLYPEVVQNSVEDIGPHKTDIYAKIHTHKIVNFLISLSRSLSSYYGRIHILGESKPHLLPVMFARLYLMKAIHQILMNGLLLLNIQPFCQM